MPLIIIVGCPSSGKSTRSTELKEFFETQKEKTVHIISENDIIKSSGIPKNDVYESSQKEKMIRADLKSNSLRKLNKNDLVIIDGGNYIKGYRYEIYCASKSARWVSSSSAWRVVTSTLCRILLSLHTLEWALLRTIFSDTLWKLRLQSHQNRPFI